MSNQSYPPPLDALLTLGPPIDCGRDDGSDTEEVDHEESCGCESCAHEEAALDDAASFDPPEWSPPPGLPAFTNDHIDELLRMATDGALHTASDDRCWAPMHAWRALADLCRDADAATAGRVVPPLLANLDRLDRLNDDLGLEDFPPVIERIGPNALPFVAAYFRDQRHKFGARLFACDALERLAVKYPHARDAVRTALRQVLALARFNEPTMNGQIIGAMIEMNDVASLPMIRKAYEDGHVDEWCNGPLERIEEEIGMTKEQRRAKLREQIDAAENDPPSVETMLGRLQDMAESMRRGKR